MLWVRPPNEIKNPTLAAPVGAEAWVLSLATLSGLKDLGLPQLCSDSIPSPGTSIRRGVQPFRKKKVLVLGLMPFALEYTRISISRGFISEPFISH